MQVFVGHFDFKSMLKNTFHLKKYISLHYLGRRYIVDLEQKFQDAVFILARADAFCIGSDVIFKVLVAAQ